jgi:predicted ribosome quality control (RQC) complex YloA/Tae2 family protein
MQLEQLANQLSGMKQMMNQEQIEINIAALRRVLDDVLTLSHEQEALRDNVRPVSPDNPVLRSLSQQQSDLTRGLTLVSDTLQKLSEKIPQMSRSVQRETGDALLSMDRAVTEMAERQVERVTGHQKSSMMHLNNLALMLSDLMDQMMNAAGGMGGGMSMQQLLQQLQQMSGQQQGINEQIQQMLNDMVGNRMSVDQQERLEQLRSQQEALRRQLEELSQDDEAAERILGDLKRIAEQMQESIEEMQRRELGRPLVRRQQEILSRLLDAQRSIRERGREERREGEQARESRRTPPPPVPASNPADRLRRDLLRALEAGYSIDYEELIKRYFEVLQDQQGPSGR